MIVESIVYCFAGILVIVPILGLIANIVIFFTETKEEYEERMEREMKIFFAKAKAIAESNGRYGWLDR